MTPGPNATKLFITHTTIELVIRMNGISFLKKLWSRYFADCIVTILLPRDQMDHGLNEGLKSGMGEIEKVGNLNLDQSCIRTHSRAISINCVSELIPVISISINCVAEFIPGISISYQFFQKISGMLR
jgi:hypothetical protein